MGGKHLKRLRAEKAKVQLKKKKKILPKGQNVTDTSFKAKKIVTIEQLKKVDESEPVSSWNLSLKDLINRLSHYNCAKRLNSLAGIKELITNYPQILEGPSLRDIITRVLELLIDVEHKVRSTAIQLLNEIFSQLPPHFLIPFYDLLNVHVCCAMTHRELFVQKDSLKFVNVMVQYAAEAVNKNVSNLIQNFVRILSGYNYGHHSEAAFSKKSKQDLEKTKTEMLCNFYQLLDTVYSLSKTESCKNSSEVASKKGRFELKKVNNFYKEIPDLSSLFKKSKGNKFLLVEQYSDEYQLQVSSIVPLLFDTWAEFAPTQKSDNYTSECLLTESVANLLHVILEILLLLYEKVVEMDNGQLETWFLSTYGPTFMKLFMQNFPYLPTASTSISSNLFNPKFSPNRQTVYMTQNIILSYLYHRFKSKCRNGELEVKIERYIFESLNVKNPPGIEILAKVIQVVIQSQKKIKLEDMIKSVVRIHDSTNNPEYRRRLFEILVKILLSEKHVAVRKIDHFKRWMKSLPNLLLEKKIPSYVVETLSRIVSREVGIEIVKEVEEKAFVIASELPNVAVEGRDQLEGQKSIANILYWCKNEVLENLMREKSAWDKSYSPELREYVLGLFSYKLKTAENLF